MTAGASTRRIRPVVRFIGALCALAAAAGMARAQGWVDGAYLQLGRTQSDARSITAGVMWKWDRTWPLWGGEVGGYWELGIAHWSAPAPGDGRDEAVVTQLSLTPTFRWRPDDGRSPWFAEGAIGFSLMGPVYETRGKRFSTAFNFADHIAVGRNFGLRGEHELALRLEHFSNGGVRKPNPGENFVQLRYTYWWP